jgi:outer membrane receptor protein involved in Fe transport
MRKSPVFLPLSATLLAALLLAGVPLYPQSITTDTLQIGEVVVTGTRVEVSRKNVPLAVSLVSRQELEESTESALLPVLSEQIPGLFVTERGITGFGVATGAAGQINMRGLGGNPTTQVLVLIDGNPQFMGLMGHPLPDAYVTSDAEKVEVIRGPASFLYGSNAFGGVINIITRKQKENGLEANARIQYGSFNTQKYMGSLGYRKDNFNIFASFNHDRTDGHRDTSDFRISNGYLKAEYRFNSRFNLFADASLAGYNTADPGPVGGVAGERIDILRGKASLSLENKTGKLEGALKLYYNYGDHDITDGWHSVDNMEGIMLYQGMKFFSGNTFTVGLDYMHYGGKGSPITTVLRNDQGEVIMPPVFQLSPLNDRWTGMSNTAFYATVQQILLGELTLSGGLRYEMNATYGNEWIPQFGLSWNPARGTSIKGSVSKGYRAPSIRELYLFPPANDRLVPERMINYEIGWNQQWMKGRMSTELTAFLADGDNLIVLVPPAAPPPPQYRNSGEFRNLGIESAWHWRPREGLDVDANYTWIHMKEPLPATPEHNLFVSGRYRLGKWNFLLKVQNIFNLYNAVADGIVVVEKNYQVLGARVGYHATRFLDVFLAGNNLLDQAYQINYGYPMPGVSVLGGISLRLSTHQRNTGHE